MTRSPRDMRRAGETRKGLLFLGIAAAIIFGVSAFYVATLRGQQELDSATLCPAMSSTMAVLVVDVTDPMNAPQKQDFLNQLARLKNAVPRYGQLTIVRVDAAAGGLLRPVITRCNPGTAADTSDLKGNPAKLQRQWEEGFSKPLDEAFASITEASGSETSPIFEAVQSVGLTELQKPGREGVPKQLILASDLLQNTPTISFYQGLPDPTDFVRSDAFRRVRTNLQGVKIELWQIQRLDSSKTQPRALSELWEKAINEMGGSVERIYNVSG